MGIFSSDSEKKLLRKLAEFIMTSGVGFLIDFTIYTVLTKVFGLEVFTANCISSLPAITFVFFTSTSKIFARKQSRVPVWAKYLIYLIYQAVLVYCVSILGELVNAFILDNVTIELILSFSKLAAKIIITPVTMVCNFFMMRLLTEKL